MPIHIVNRKLREGDVVGGRKFGGLEAWHRRGGVSSHAGFRFGGEGEVSHPTSRSLTDSVGTYDSGGGAPLNSIRFEDRTSCRDTVMSAILIVRILSLARTSGDGRCVGMEAGRRSFK
jgi:hypothetical protein